MDAQKRPQIDEPTRQCQYGVGCYRKNPQHFTEYAHNHLTDIRLSGWDTTSRTYSVPKVLHMSRDVVIEQLQILDKLFPRSETSVKKHKLDADSADVTGTDTAGVATPSTSTSAAASTPVNTKPTRVPVTAAQLKTELSSATTKTSLSHSDQLAAYCERHNKRAATASTSQPSTSLALQRPVASTTQSGNPHTRPPPRNIEDYISVVNPRGQMAAKLAAAAPYNFFLTTITAAPATHSEPLSITFQEILDSSLGTIDTSVQMNFMIDIGWLLGHYYFAGCLDKPLLVLYGDETPELLTIGAKKPQVTAIKVQMSSPFGTHHTKMMLLGYADGSMRVVVSTANLLEDDWHNRTQGLWISPRCERMPDDADTTAGAGATGFRDDLVRYLVTYNLPRLQPWIARVRRSDFSAVNVFFVASVPGGHRESAARGHDWGHARVGRLLGQHSAPVDDSSPIVAQSSSIGSLGPNVESWIMTDLANSFRRDSAPIGLRRLPSFRMVYPSYATVRSSHDDLLGGGCLPYRRAVDVKQSWLKTHLYHWRSAGRHRSRAMPHIKTYARWSSRGLYWFCLTSANLSKAAWGAFNKSAKLDAPLRIASYEAGVLFLPKFVLGVEARFFPLGKYDELAPPFPMPYDLELLPYGTADTPFVMDYLLERN